MDIFLLQNMINVKGGQLLKVNINCFERRSYMRLFNNKKKLLPMKLPIVTSYPYHADILSVVSNNDDYLPWFFNNYIQLNYPNEIFKDGARLDFYMSCLWETCPYISYQLVSKDFVSFKWESIIQFIIDSVDLGFYIRLMVDKFYISSYWISKKKHVPHDIFIFGYNTEDKTFNVADNFKYGKYSFEKVSYINIEKGYKGIQENRLLDFLNGIEMIRPKEDQGAYGFEHKYKFDIDLVKNSIKDYLAAENNNSIKWHYIPSMQWKYGKDCYGVDIYSKLIEYINSLVETIGIDMRPFNVLWEHKKVMLLRIEYMIDNNFLNDSDSILKAYSDIERQAFFLNNLWIKYSIKRDKRIIEKMNVAIEKIKFEEISVFEDILNELNYS